jgi:hypothetical protein
VVPPSDRQRPTDCGRSRPYRSIVIAADACPSTRWMTLGRYDDDRRGLLASVRVWALPGLLAIVTYGLVDRHWFAYPL